MNDVIKAEIRTQGIKQWQLAQAIGISERTLIVWLRTKLSPEREARIKTAIEKIAKEGQ